MEDPYMNSLKLLENYLTTIANRHIQLKIIQNFMGDQIFFFEFTYNGTTKITTTRQ